MTREDFGAAKFAWLKRVCSDARVSHIAARIAVLISDRVNGKTLDAFPGQDLLASESGVTPRYVRTAVEQLETLGYLTIIRSGRAPNRYRPHFDAPSGSPVPVEQDADRNNGSDQGALPEEQEFRSNDPSSGTGVPVEQGPEPFDRNNSSAPTGTGVPPNPSREQLIEDTPLNPPLPVKRAVSTSRAAITAAAKAAFGDWWEGYPLKKGRKEAERAFVAALVGGKATLEELYHGRDAYAEECRRLGRDPSKIKYAQGWLNGERWKDAPLPASAQAAGRPAGFSYTDYAVDRLDLFGAEI